MDWRRGYGGWHLYTGFYGTAQAVEAELCLHAGENYFIGLGLQIGFEGSYQARITDRVSAAGGRQALVLVKRTGAMVPLEIRFLDEAGIRIKPGEAFRMALLYDDGVLTVQLGGRTLIRYDDSASHTRLTAGECGVWIYPERGGSFRDFTVRGNPRERPETGSLQAPKTRYVLDPAAAPAGGLPAGWEQRPYAADWAATADGVLRSSLSVRAEAWLHLFDNDPVVEADLVPCRLRPDSDFGILIRRAPETAFIRLGYRVQEQRWYIEDTPALYDCETRRVWGEPFPLEEGRTYHVSIAASGRRVTLTVDGRVTAADVRHTGYGRIGLFAEQAEVGITAFSVQPASGAVPVDGAVTVAVDDGNFAASMELETTGAGELIGITKNGIYRSADEGLSFARTEAYSGLDTHGAYQSVLRLRSGGYLQVLLAQNTEVQVSDDLKSWKTVGRVVPEEMYEAVGRGNVLFHVGSLTACRGEDGGERLFLPVTIRRPERGKRLFASGGRDTVVFYSDDGGCSWQMSDTWISSLLAGRNDGLPPEWAESKVIRCADGSLRLYNSRNRSRFLAYAESLNFGKSWTGPYVVREMQSPMSSFAVCEDPQREGTYYLVWVNDRPFVRGSTMPRTRLSLAMSTDGKIWRFLADVERMGVRFADYPPFSYVPLFQILDPCVLVTDRYVYVSWGESARGAEDVRPGEARACHHEQRVRLARFEKSRLRVQEWSAATVCDPALLQEDLSREIW